MSAKEHFISQLNTARYEHKKWLNTIKVLVSGISMDKDSIPLNEMDTPFGTWLYRDAMLMSTHTTKLALEEMTKLYTQCYESYFMIYNLVFAGKSEGFLGFFSNKKSSNSEILLAQKYYEELVVISDALLKRIRVFESQVHAISSEKFDALYAKSEPEALPVHAEDAPEAPLKVPRYYRGSLIED